MRANISENSSKRRIDRGPSANPLGRARGWVKHGRRVGKSRAKRLPIKILERNEEAAQRLGNGS
jgi:hypothetical protein